jgi:nuclear cap-binding protein subunit 1
LDLPKSSTRHAFLCHLVDCCVRLSYPDQIKAILPATYTSNADLWDANGPRINYFMPSVDAPLYAISQDLTSALRIKDSGETIEKCLGMIREWTLTASNDAKEVFMYRDDEGIASQVFVQCLMFIGQKSFSHLLNAVERNIVSVQGYMSGEKGVALVAHVWTFHPQFLEICVDKLTNYRVFSVYKMSFNVRPRVLSLGSVNRLDMKTEMAELRRKRFTSKRCIGTSCQACLKRLI